MIQHFISSKILIFFQKVQNSRWQNNLDYCKGNKIVNNLKAVNNTVKRAVKLIEYLNKRRPKN